MWLKATLALSLVSTLLKSVCCDFYYMLSTNRGGKVDRDTYQFLTTCARWRHLPKRRNDSYANSNRKRSEKWIMQEAYLLYIQAQY